MEAISDIPTLPQAPTKSDKQPKRSQESWELMLESLFIWTSSIPVVGLLAQGLLLKLNPTWCAPDVVPHLTSPYLKLSAAFDKSKPNRFMNFLNGAFHAILPLHNLLYLIFSPIFFVSSIGSMIKDAFQWIAKKVSSSKQSSTTTPQNEQSVQQAASFNNDSALPSSGSTFTPSSDAAMSSSASSATSKSDTSQEKAQLSKQDSPTCAP